jgi:hypothetical protein
MLKMSVGRAWTELMWLRIGASGKLFHAVVNLQLLYNTAALSTSRNIKYHGKNIFILVCFGEWILNSLWFPVILKTQPSIEWRHGHIHLVSRLRMELDLYFPYMPSWCGHEQLYLSGLFA